MRLSKAQGVVITLLNVLIVVLVTVALFVPQSFWQSITGDAPASEANATPVVPGDSSDDPVDPPHEKLRPATSGVSDAVKAETRLMGLGDETVVATYTHGDDLYVFGNAPVAGLDFDTYGGFLCMLGQDGTIKRYTYFTGNITAVGFIAGGYAVAAGGAVYFVDYTGAKTQVLSAESVVDVFTVEGETVAVVTRPAESSLVYSEYTVGKDGVWAKGKVTRIDGGYSLRYFDCFMLGDTRVIAARAYSLPRFDALVLYSFRPSGDASAHYYGGNDDALMRPYAVLPAKDGYIALVSRGGIATVLGIDYDFETEHIRSLGFTFYDARMFLCNKKYYANFDRTAGSVTYELNGFSEGTPISVADGLTLDKVINVDGEPLFIGSVQKNGTVAATTANELVIVGENSRVALKANAAAVCGAYVVSGGLRLVMSCKGGADFSEPTAGRDIYVAVILR